MRVEDGAATLTQLPGLADNDWQYNATSYNQSVSTVGTLRYATWVDDARHPIIAQQTLGGAWTTFDFTTLGGLMGALVPNDAHNVINHAVDADGYVHVSGNMHGDWLRYARSNAPGDITAWTNRDMLRSGAKTGTDEGLVTYPRFITNPVTGELLFMYRNGASGSGVIYLNAYDTATQTWSRRATLIDGAATGHSAYENTPVIDTDGVLHLSWSWAASGSTFNERHDVCYMRSHDGGATFETIDGAPVTLPVTYGASAPTVLDTAASNNGMLNQSGMDVDNQGRPHIAMHYADDGNRNIFHLWHDGTTWQLEKVTDLSASALAWETLPSRPAMLCHNGRSYVLWRHQYERRRGYVWMSDVTNAEPVHFPILRTDLRDWEPTFDPTRLRNGEMLDMLVTRVNSDATAPRLGYGDDNWKRQPLGILSIDMSKIAGLRDGTSALPRLPRR